MDLTILQDALEGTRDDKKRKMKLLYTGPRSDRRDWKPTWFVLCFGRLRLLP